MLLTLYSDARESKGDSSFQVSLSFLETRMYLWSKKEDGDDDARRRRKGKFFSVHESRRHTVLLYIDCWSEWGVSSSKGKVRTFLEELEEGRLQERKSIHSLLPSQTIIERQKEQQQICCGIRRRTRYLYKFNVSKFLACSSLEFRDSGVMPMMTAFLCSCSPQKDLLEKISSWSPSYGLKGGIIELVSFPSYIFLNLFLDTETEEGLKNQENCSGLSRCRRISWISFLLPPSFTQKRWEWFSLQEIQFTFTTLSLFLTLVSSISYDTRVLLE